MLLYVDSRFASPYALSACVALHEKGLTFEMVPVDLAAQAQLEPHFTHISLTRRIPTLVHEDFSLSESSAIAEYVDEVFPGTPLYPKEPQPRAQARQVQAWLRSSLMSIRTERSTEVVFYGAKKPSLSAEAEAEVALLFSAALRLLGKRSDHLFDTWSLADVDLAMMIKRLVAHGDSVPDQLVDYTETQWQRPSVRHWLAQDRAHSAT